MKARKEEVIQEADTTVQTTGNESPSWGVGDGGGTRKRQEEPNEKALQH